VREIAPGCGAPSSKFSLLSEGNGKITGTVQEIPTRRWLCEAFGDIPALTCSAGDEEERR